MTKIQLNYEISWLNHWQKPHLCDIHKWVIFFSYPWKKVIVIYIAIVLFFKIPIILQDYYSSGGNISAIKRY